MNRPMPICTNRRGSKRSASAPDKVENSRKGSQCDSMAKPPKVGGMKLLECDPIGDGVLNTVGHHRQRIAGKVRPVAWMASAAKDWCWTAPEAVVLNFFVLKCRRERPPEDLVYIQVTGWVNAHAPKARPQKKLGHDPVKIIA